MLLFGHIGITLAAAALLNRAITGYHSWGLKGDNPESGGVVPEAKKHNDLLRSIFPGSIDIRVLLVGSLLPDIIDKPVGEFIFRETFANGRIMSHTLLFFVVILAAGMFLYLSGGRSWLLVLAAGTFFHLVLDEMWLTPQTLLWPLYGWSFPRLEEDFLGSIFQELFADPGVYVPEIIGLAVLAVFAWAVVHRRLVLNFIRKGRL